MRTDVLQAISICLHGNAYLAEPVPERACEMLGTNTLFKSVFEIAFERKPVGSRTIMTLGNSVAPWLRRLRAEDVPQVRLYLSKVPCSIDKTPDGPWGIVSDGDAGTELWQPKWKGRLVRYDEPPSWKVTYTADRFVRWTMADPPPAREANASLEEHWSHLNEVAERMGNAEIADLSERFLNLHRKESPLCPGFPDFLPASMEDEARNVAASAVRAIICLSGNAWAGAMHHREFSEFSTVTRRLWQASLVCFESVAYGAERAKAS